MYTSERLTTEEQRIGETDLVIDDTADEATSNLHESKPVAVLIPCRNEELTVRKVVTDFQAALPKAIVYVYDNASEDDTVAEARRAGAVVRSVPSPGKGNVLRQMLTEVEAAVYVLADGDDTYDASSAPAMVNLLIRQGLDMVVGTRVEANKEGACYRRGHRFGNKMLTSSVRLLFGEGPADMLTGYRAFSRRYAKSFPGMATGFEVETEMTLHAMDLRLPVMEIPTPYRERPEDSQSKLRTTRDGIRILRFILALFRAYRPLGFFSGIGLLAALSAAVCASLGPMTFQPWSLCAVLFIGYSAMAIVSVLAGIVLDSLRRNQREMKRMLYLTVPTALGGVPWL